MSRRFGKVCPKHPELNGERTPKSYCMGCKRDRERAKDSGYAAAYRKDLFRYAVLKLKDVRAKAKREGVDFDLDKEWVLSRLDHNQSRCELSGLPFVLSDGLDQRTLSFDRLDPEKGYVKGNVRMVLFCVNNMRRQFGDKEFIERLEHHTYLDPLYEYVKEQILARRSSAGI